MAQELVERFPQKFSVDFQSDKKSVDFLTNVKSKKLRNRIADYITRIMGIAYEKEELEDPSDIDWARHRSASLHISMVVKRHRDVRKAIE